MFGTIGLILAAPLTAAVVGISADFARARVNEQSEPTTEQSRPATGEPEPPPGVAEVDAATVAG